MIDQVASSNVRVGCVYRPQFAPERLANTAAAADSAGLDELWLWEDCFLAGGISAAAIALAHSTRLTIGIGVLPVPMRNVALTAMEIATLARCFTGRVRIGVGHGVQDWMAQIGAKVDSPMTLLREHLTTLRALLRGEEVTIHGRYVHLDEVKLDWPPSADLELLVGASGPRSLRLSGELATGTVITGGTTPAQLRNCIESIQTGIALNPRPPRHSVVTYLLCTTGPRARQDLLDEIEHWGFDPNADVGVCGTAEEIAAAAQRWIQAGAGTLILQPTGGAHIEEFVEFVGHEVRPKIIAP